VVLRYMASATADTILPIDAEIVRSLGTLLSMAA
jgi:hypothetical protein